MGFAEISISTSIAELTSRALERLTLAMEAKGYVGWKPQPADVLTILIESLGPLMANLSSVASAVPLAAFRNFGTQLLGVAFNPGAAASASTRWTLMPDGEGKYPARTIRAGTQLALGSFGFYTASQVEVPEGASSATVRILALEYSAAYNKLTGLIEPVEAIDWVKEVTLEGETTGGAEPESDEEYLTRLSQALTQLALLRPITASDYAICAQAAPSTVLPSGVEVGRATAIDGYNPETTGFTGTLTEGSSTITAVSSFTGISAGSTPSRLEGAYIPAGTVVKELKVSEKEIVMSAVASKAATGAVLKAIGSGENERTVTVFVTDKEGKALSAEAMAALEKWLRERREINFDVFVRAASYTHVYITAKLHLLPGWEEAGVITAATEALEGFLSPAKWGNPSSLETGANTWLNQVQGYSTVRYNQVLGVLSSVRGVAYVFPGSEGLAIGLSASPTGTSDLTLEGPAPLPETGASYIKITTG